MYVIFLMILSLILVVLSILSVVRNFLSSYNVSDSGGKTVALAILVVICLIGAVICYTEAYEVKDLNTFISSSESIGKDIEKIERQIPIKTTIASISISVGYIVFLIHLQLIKQIKKSKLKQVEVNRTKSWAKRTQL